jgi:hypothetical protein
VAQNYLPEAIKGMRFYQPSDQGYETQVVDRLARWRKAVEQALSIEPHQGPQVTEQEIIGLKKRLK